MGETLLESKGSLRTLSLSREAREADGLCPPRALSPPTEGGIPQRDFS